jgi:hypothetical protein
MGPLRLAHLLFETDDLHPVFAQRAIHRGAPLYRFARALDQHVGHQRIHAEIPGLQHFKLRFALAQVVHRRVDALDQHAVEQEERQHDQARIALPRGVAQTFRHQRRGAAGVTDHGGAETHAFFQHPCQFGDVAVGVRIGGAAPDQHQAGIGAPQRLRRGGFGLHDALLRQLQ